MAGHARWVSASDLVKEFGFTSRHWTRMASAGRVPSAHQPFGPRSSWTFEITEVRTWWEASVEQPKKWVPTSPAPRTTKSPLVHRPSPFDRRDLKKTLASIMAAPPTPKKRPPPRDRS